MGLNQGPETTTIFLKASCSNIKTSHYGGVVPILKCLKESGVASIIRAELGTRKKQSKYTYADILISWTLAMLCGYKKLEHISRFEEKAKIIRGLKIPTPDTLGRVMKRNLATEIAEEDIISRNNKGELKINTNYFNDNLKMNSMLIRTTKKLGALKEGVTYTLHVDATFIKTLCAGSGLDKKNARHGFHPMVCSIGDLIVFVSMRNGNSGAKFQIKECLDMLQKNKIRIGKVISDGAGYNKELVDMLDARGVKFNIHMSRNKNYKKMRAKLAQASWKKTVIETALEFKECEIGEIKYKMIGGKKPMRLIIARVPTGKKMKNRNKSVEKKMAELKEKKRLKSYKKYSLGKWKKLGKYKVKLTITNDYSLTPEEVIMEYNKRGASEREFEYMKNDFAWKYPPFQNMNENAVFLIATAFANNVMRAMVMKFKSTMTHLRFEARLPDFMANFIEVSIAYINKEYIFFDSKEDYVKLLI